MLGRILNVFVLFIVSFLFGCQPKTVEPAQKEVELTKTYIEQHAKEID